MIAKVRNFIKTSPHLTLCSNFQVNLLIILERNKSFFRPKSILHLKPKNMKKLYYLLILVIITTGAEAQTPQTVILDNNRISAKDVKPELQYLFPDFQTGRVVLKDRRSINCQLNYNFLLDEMLFINENGKKMALANPQDILHVYIGNRLFVASDKGYFEVIEKEPVSLVYKWTCNISEKGKEGALGITTDAPSVYQMNQISFDSRTWKLDVDKEAVITIKVTPYLKYKSKFIPVKGMKDFFRAFPGKSSYIKVYLAHNPIDFKKEADLRRLTKYCNSL